MTRSSLEQSLALMSCNAGLAPSNTARPTPGPGWFESSWDLRRGLEVREGGAADAGLRTWIEDFLGPQAGSPASAEGASFSAR